MVPAVRPSEITAFFRHGSENVFPDGLPAQNEVLGGSGRPVTAQKLALGGSDGAFQATFYHLGNLSDHPAQARR